MSGSTIGGGLAGVVAETGPELSARIHSVETFGTVDGPGIRYVVFFQGCPLRCLYCHNRDTWERSGGSVVNVIDLAVDIERYARFLRPCGGGVTATGGEPLLQADAVTRLFSLVHGLGLSTALDTSGYAALNEPIDRLLAETDLVLLDLKQLNDTRHRDLVGVSNRLVLEFAREVSDRGLPIWLRHVVVPGYTTDVADLEALAGFAASLSGVQRVELLAYHEMGRHKWEAVGARYRLADVRSPTSEQMDAAAGLLRRYGLPVCVSDHGNVSPPIDKE